MTPKQKAIELVQKFIDNAYQEDNDGLYTPLAKKCALIAVDEIINTGALANNHFNIDNVTKEYIQYWQEVKAEIEKM